MGKKDVDLIQVLNLIKGMETQVTTREDLIEKIWQEHRQDKFKMHMYIRPDIKEPNSIYKLDVQHFLTCFSVAWKWGPSVAYGGGLLNETLQTFSWNPNKRASAWHEEDLLSNKWGITFYDFSQQPFKREKKVSKLLHFFMLTRLKPILLSQKKNYTMKEHSGSEVFGEAMLHTLLIPMRAISGR